MDDDKLAIEEARRAGQHGSVKSQVEGEVQAEIAERAADKPAPESDRVDQVAGQFRAKAVDEVVETEREVGRGRLAARVSQIVDYIFWVIYALLGMRFLLALLAARSGAGFVRFIVAVTDPFYRPFRGIVSSPTTDGGHTLMVPLIIAIVVYLLLHLAINGLLLIIAHRKTSVYLGLQINAWQSTMSYQTSGSAQRESCEPRQAGNGATVATTACVAGKSGV